MVKLVTNRIEAFVRKPDPGIRAVLVYGPDSGLVRERAVTLGKTVLDDLNDPFRVAELSVSAIESNPAALADEMAAMSLTGGRRLIRIREAGEGLTAAFTAVFKDPPPGDTLVVIEAGDLDKKSKLRALFENADFGAAIPCYVEDESSLERVIGDLLAQHGLTISADARSYLAACLVGDRALARNEIAKLALYMGDEKRVELQDAQACIGDSDTAELDEPVWAAADGDAVQLDHSLEALLAQGTSPVGILRAAQRHFERLHRVSTKVAQGMPLPNAVTSLKPPVFFKQQARFTTQARRWSPAMLTDALARLVDAEADCKRTGLPDTAICSRTLHQLARAARRAG